LGSIQEYYREFTALENSVYGVTPDASRIADIIK